MRRDNQTDLNFTFLITSSINHENLKKPKESTKDLLFQEILIRFNHCGLLFTKEPLLFRYYQNTKDNNSKDWHWTSGIETSYILISTNSSLSN